MAKLPAIQFYVGDWLKDQVTSCSIGAQGLWLRLLLIMHDSDRYGCLTMGGKPMPEANAARRCGVSLEEYKTLFEELKDAGVPRLSEEGFWYSKRLVEDQKKRDQDASRQRKHRRQGHEIDGNDIENTQGSSLDGAGHAHVTHDVTQLSHPRHADVTHDVTRLSEDEDEDENEDEIQNSELNSTGSKNSKPREVFRKPTLDEVAAYCAERKNNVDPQAWHDHYTSNGWKVGKNPMRDWQAAVRTWERTDYAKPKLTRSQQLDLDAKRILARAQNRGHPGVYRADASVGWAPTAG